MDDYEKYNIKRLCLLGKMLQKRNLSKRSFKGCFIHDENFNLKRVYEINHKMWKYIFYGNVKERPRGNYSI